MLIYQSYTQPFGLCVAGTAPSISATYHLKKNMKKTYTKIERNNYITEGQRRAIERKNSSEKFGARFNADFNKDDEYPEVTDSRSQFKYEQTYNYSNDLFGRRYYSGGHKDALEQLFDR